MSDVFVSYRRSDGSAMAQLIEEKLEDLGYSVFLDYHSLGRGDFDVQLQSEIRSCRDFLLVLSPDVFGTIFEPESVIRREIECALKSSSNIVLVMMVGFTWPDRLPESIKAIRTIQGVNFNFEYADASMQRICSYMQSEPKKKNGRKSASKWSGAVLIVVSLAIVCAVFAGYKFLSVGEEPQTEDDATPDLGFTLVDPSEAGADDYVLADSASHEFSREEVEPLSTTQLRYAQYEILARYGLIFDDEELAEYFAARSWFEPIFTEEQWANQYDGDTLRPLTRVERANWQLFDEMREQRAVESAKHQTPLIPPDQTGPDDYVLADTETYEYTREEAEQLSNRELYYARNEIIARYGRSFLDNNLTTYFEGKNWYEERFSTEEWQKIYGKYADEEQSEFTAPLKAIEKSNWWLFLKIEEGRNSPYLDDWKNEDSEPGVS